MNIVCVIPARYQSSRFLGKSLALIKGSPMIYWVWKNAVESKAFDDVIVATDDEKISSTVRDFGGYAMMTSDRCFSMTNRIQQVSNELVADLYVNLQGDEPLMKPATLNEFVSELKKDRRFDVYDTMMTCSSMDIHNPNVVKVVTNGDKLLYASRHPIPYVKNKSYIYKKELGLKAHTKYGLDIYSKFPKGLLELAEEIDFMRYIENEIPVKMIELDIKYPIHSVDVPEDIERVESLMEKIKENN